MHNGTVCVLQEEIEDLVNDWGWSVADAERIVIENYLSYKKSHPFMYDYIIKNHDVSGNFCMRKCKINAPKQAVFMFSKYLPIKRALSQLTDVPKVEQMPKETPLGHLSEDNPYIKNGLALEQQNLSGNVSNNENYSNLRYRYGQDASHPHFAGLDKRIRDHFGGKHTLDSFTKMHHMPGQTNRLNFSETTWDGQPDNNEGIRLDHSVTDSNGDNALTSRTTHKNQFGKNYVKWDYIRNEGGPTLMRNYLSSLVPAYRDSGIDHIKTFAMSAPEEKFNGGTSWANMGFDFADKDEADYARTKLGWKVPKQEESLSRLEQPHHFLDHIRQNPQFRALGNPRKTFEDAIGSYYAKLPLQDPNHEGFKRAKRVLGIK